MKLGQVCLRRGRSGSSAGEKGRVYDNEAAWVDEDCTDGGVVDVIDGTGAFVARRLLQQPVQNPGTGPHPGPPMKPSTGSSFAAA